VSPGEQNGATPTVDAVDDVATDESESGEVTFEATEPVDVPDMSQAARRDGIVKRALRGARSRAAVAVLAAVLVASVGVAAWLYVNQYRPDRQTDPAAAKVAIDAASSGTVALLSYSPDSLDKDFATAKSHLTGEFLSYYTQFTDQIVKPAAQQKAVRTSAAVVRAAVSEIRPDSAIVLVFVNQMTSSEENPGGALAASSVRVELTKVNGTWLISSFDPV